ncbi:hypothetical protein S40293_10456 [Stachybotrys chartarum IBT 40293]|nr:hypothetical protein S40293_10456 [Stachybotrys chartarum IBT 40293]
MLPACRVRPRTLMVTHPTCENRRDSRQDHPIAQRNRPVSARQVTIQDLDGLAQMGVGCVGRVPLEEQVLGGGDAEEGALQVDGSSKSHCTEGGGGGLVDGKGSYEK